MIFEPLASQAGHIHVCGHRGHSAGAPENTIPALQSAARYGATVAEIDVVLTRDDQIVLLHDEILDRTTDGTGRASDRDLALIGKLDAGSWFSPDFAKTPVPTLREALAVARDEKLGLLVEIKERSREPVMLERLGALLEAETAVDGVLVISFDHTSLARLTKCCPGLRTELITHARHNDPAAMAARAGAASVSIEWDMFHPDDATELHAAGVAVRVTLPRPEVLARRKSYGFDDMEKLADYLADGLIDCVAGDDVMFVKKAVDGHRL